MNKEDPDLMHEIKILKEEINAMSYEKQFILSCKYLLDKTKSKFGKSLKFLEKIKNPSICLFLTSIPSIYFLNSDKFE